MDIQPNPNAPDQCILEHRVFTSFGYPVFRKAETDGEPVMVVQLGEKEAAIPLHSLQREFSIANSFCNEWSGIAASFSPS